MNLNGYLTWLGIIYSSVGFIAVIGITIVLVEITDALLNWNARIWISVKKTFPSVFIKIIIGDVFEFIRIRIQIPRSLAKENDW